MKFSTFKIVFLAILATAAFWLLDSFLDSYLLYGGESFRNVLFSHNREIYFRLILATCFFAIAVFILRSFNKRKRIEDLLKNEIKEREAAEEALEKSEELYRSLFESASDAIFLMKAEGEDAGRIMATNRSAAQMHGYTIDELLRMKIMDVDTPESARNSKSLIESIFQNGSVKGELGHRRRDGSEFPVEFSAGLVEFGGEKFVLAVDRDITERKATENQLRLYSEAIEAANDCIHIVDLKGYILYCNKAVKRVYGYSPEELRGVHVSFLHSDKEIPERVIMPSIQKTGNWDGEVLFQDKNGRVFPVWLTATCIRGGQSEPIAMVGIVRDISDRKQTENQLRLYSEAIEAANDCIQILDLNGCIIYSSKAVEKIYGYTPGELTGVHVSFLNADKRIADQEIVPSMLKNGMWDGELMVKHKDGRTFPIWLTASFIKNGQNEPIAMVGIIKDITERKRTEDLVKTSLREKETLIKEIYHRTKNNMQVISSLLNLQVSAIGDERLSGIFRETQNRIKAMSLVHEKLYQSGDLSKIIIKNYIEDLVNALIQSFRPESEKINVCYDLEELSLPLETMTPVGLIINELMSNSLKYAFPDKNGNCEVRISLHSAGDDELKLVFSDNGIGLPEGFDLKKVKTLGLNLIQNLAEKQLNGRVELHMNKGTEFRIIFKQVRIKSRTATNRILTA